MVGVSGDIEHGGRHQEINFLLSRNEKKFIFVLGFQLFVKCDIARLSKTSNICKNFNSFASILKSPNWGSNFTWRENNFWKPTLVPTALLVFFAHKWMSVPSLPFTHYLNLIYFRKLQTSVVPLRRFVKNQCKKIFTRINCTNSVSGHVKYTNKISSISDLCQKEFLVSVIYVKLRSHVI